MIKNQQKSIFELVCAGLWERDVELRSYGAVDFSEVYRFAEEQSVIGLVAAGLEHVADVKVPQQWALQLAGQTLQLEQRNKAMNSFIASLVEKMRAEGIYALLVKGQGIAQCYERPLWRACGDVDLFFDKVNYEKAKAFLTALASQVEPEDKSRLHLGMTIDNWIVELHGTLHSEISKRMDQVVDIVQQDIFENEGIRQWSNGGVEITLPNADNDVIIVFAHFLHHFYIGGIGLRQICDWCRLMWTYKDTLNCELLESRIRKMGLMQEWKCFCTLAIDYLGMPIEAVPLFEPRDDYHRKAKKVMERVLTTGNMGHNIDMSYRKRHSKIGGLIITFWRRMKEFIDLTMIFPKGAPVIFATYVMGRAKDTI